jgi:hypothetical protein
VVELVSVNVVKAGCAAAFTLAFSDAVALTALR